MYMLLYYKTGANVHEALHRQVFTCKDVFLLRDSLSPKPSSECMDNRIATGSLYEKCRY